MIDVRSPDDRMPPFPKPRTRYRYDLDSELESLRAHKKLRAIPAKAEDRLLLATWNIANLGVQERREDDYQLLAEIVGWFDLVAVQEVNDNLAGLRALESALGGRYRVLFSEAAGNYERQAFLFDPDKVTALEKVGRLAVPPSQQAQIRLPVSAREDLPDQPTPFTGFDRGPYLAAFRVGQFTLLLVSVHLFFGSDAPADMLRRSLETYAVAWWADRRRRSKHAFTRDIVPLGDFNLPELAPSDPIRRALTSKGLALPEHSSAVGGSSLEGHHHYDQIAFFPGETKEFTGGVGTFDFDNAVFRDLWGEAKDERTRFLGYLRYYVSDHRPLWAEFQTDVVPD